MPVWGASTAERWGDAGTLAHAGPRCERLGSERRGARLATVCWAGENLISHFPTRMPAAGKVGVGGSDVPLVRNKTKPQIKRTGLTSVHLFMFPSGPLIACPSVFLGEFHRARGDRIRVGGDGEEERREHEEEQHDEDAEEEESECQVDIDHIVEDGVYVAHLSSEVWSVAWPLSPSPLRSPCTRFAQHN